MKTSIENVSKKLNRHFHLAVALVVVAMMASMTAFGADALWTTLSGTIQTWVTRLGGVVIFVGGIMFGLGWKSDDADGKSRGISTIIAGAIVMAIGALTGTFFA